MAVGNGEKCTWCGAKGDRYVQQDAGFGGEPTRRAAVRPIGPEMDSHRGNYLPDTLGGIQDHEGMEEVMLTRLEIYGVIALIIALLIGGVVIRDRIQKAEIAALKTEVANVKAQGEVIKKAQEVTDKTVAKMKVRGKVNVQDNAKIDSVVESGDSSAVDKLLRDRGMLGSPPSPAKGRPAGRPRNISP